MNESSFAALHLECVRRLLDHEALDYAAMMRRLDGCIARRPAPRPSIETLLHAALPFRYVEHTHAYDLLAAANVEHIEQVVEDIYGETAPLVPYRHSGSALARQCAEVFRRRGSGKTIGLILAFHGVVAFGNTARESYDNMIRLVTLAEDYLKASNAWDLPAAHIRIAAPAGSALAALRQQVSRIAGFSLIMRTVDDPLCLTFARRDDLETISQQGPSTPQHAIFTKRVPLLGRDVDAFALHYRDYLQRNLDSSAAGRIDPAPRIILDREFGLCALGVNADCAARAAEVYRHDIGVICRASAHDIYRSAPERDIAKAELEYGGFETTLRARATKEQPLLGQIALVTDAAAQMNPALLPRLTEQGAATVSGGACGPDKALNEAATTSGGIDLVFAATGDEKWRSAARDLLDLSPVGGRIVPIGAAT